MRQNSILNKECSIIRNIDLSLSVSLLAGFMFGVFAPYEIYLSNKEAFFFSGREMIAFSVLLFCVIFTFGTALFQLISLINQRVYCYFIAFVFSLLIFMYLQGNYDRTDYGAWDGSDINWTDFGKERVIWTIILFLCVITAVFLIKWVKYNRVKKCIKSVIAFVLAIQVITLISLLILKGGIDRASEYLAIEDGENEFSSSVSTSPNIIILSF